MSLLCLRATVASALAVGLMLLGACASGPPPPDWQLDARSALEQSIAADLRGDDRIARLEFGRAREQIARTGRPDLMARAELLRCAARVASLELAPCAGFERLSADAAAPELAYAGYLAGSLLPAQAALLPPAQQAVLALGATPADATAASTLQALADPLSRLVGAAVLLQAGAAGPAVATLAVDTASAQGWRRPLLAWLGLQRQRAATAGNAEAAARLQRRIDLVLGDAR